MTQKEKLAYLAGFIDGEGTLSITRPINPRYLSGYNYRPEVDVANTHLPVMTWIQETFGGGFSHECRKGRYKTLYRIWFGPPLQRELLPKLLPYLIVKRRQCELVLKFLEITKTMNRGDRNKDHIKHDLWVECAKLNNRKYKNKLIPRFEGLRDKVKMPIRTCGDYECTEKHYGKGYCRKHYRKVIEYPSKRLKEIK